MNEHHLIMDLDGVIQDLETIMVEIFNREHGTSFKKDDGPNWNMLPIFRDSDHFKEFFKKHRKEILLNAPLFEGAAEFFNQCYRMCLQAHWGFTFFSALIDPVDFYLKHKHVNDVLGSEIAGLLKMGEHKKDLFRSGDIIVDDCPMNLIYAALVGAHPICIAQPWNQMISKPAWEGPRYDYLMAARRIQEILEGSLHA